MKREEKRRGERKERSLLLNKFPPGGNVGLLLATQPETCVRVCVSVCVWGRGQHDRNISKQNPTASRYGEDHMIRPEGAWPVSTETTASS